jgi:hypothetical protein
MFKKLLIGCAVVAGCIAGVGVAWNFHEIMVGNFEFVTAHLWLSMILGGAFLAMLARAVYDIQKDNPRVLGILMLATAIGIVFQAIAEIPASYSDTAHTILILKLAGAVILMVNGLNHLHRKRVTSGP